MMDIGSDHATSIVDDWLARFSPPSGSKPSAFPFTLHKAQSIESRRARMSDLLIFDVLLIRGGIRNPDMLFPPPDWASLRKLLDVIHDSTYDILKKDCLVYILLKWAWDMDTKETNTGWDVRFLQDRCIAPQFAALADAYWLLDTGTHLSKAVSILSDARLNRDYVSKVLQALALSSSPASFANGTTPATAALIVKYIRSAKPLLTEPDDIDIYTLSLAQLSFLDAWAYQRSFPEASTTRERLLAKIVGWCLMPTPKQEPLAQLLAFPLSSYEQSSLHTLVSPPSVFSIPPSSGIKTHISLSLQAISILQDLLCVRAIQSGDYVGAIKLDHWFSSSFPSHASGTSSGTASQAASFIRDGIDRKAIIQDLFAALPPAERTLLEEDIGKVATGVRANAPLTQTPRQVAPAPARRPLVAELSLSASWEDVGASTDSPARSPPVSLSPSVAGPSFGSKSSLAPVPTTIGKTAQSSAASPFASRVPQPTFGRQAPPTPKFTAFGSPIPPAMGVSTGRGVISERAKTLYSTGAAGGPSIVAARVSLFETGGSAKNAPNAFYKPPSAPVAKNSLDTTKGPASASTAKTAEKDIPTVKENGKAQGGESDEGDVSMGSGSDVEIVEDRRDESGEEREEEVATEEDEDVEHFVTHDQSGAADLTLHTPHVDEAMDDDETAASALGFSVFSASKMEVQNGGVSGQGSKDASTSEHAPYVSPPRRPRVSLPREEDKSPDISTRLTASRSRAPPGAFDTEEEEDGEEPLTTPVQSPRRSMRTRRQSETPSRPSVRSQPQRSTKSTTMLTGDARRSSAHPGRSSKDLSHSIPGSLMDDDDEHGEDDAEHTDTHGDADTELDEQEEEDDALAPLPSRGTRRTRSLGLFNAPTKAKSRVIGTAATTKNKARSEVKTPARRSSRLSMASTSPDHADLASPTKGGKSTAGSRASIDGNLGGAATKRSSTRRKR